eukprot:1293656-Pleurochrysis_carterae.AAC.1
MAARVRARAFVCDCVRARARARRCVRACGCVRSPGSNGPPGRVPQMRGAEILCARESQRACDAVPGRPELLLENNVQQPREDMESAFCPRSENVGKSYKVRIGLKRTCR